MNQKKGRKEWQKDAYTKAHNRLRETFMDATDALTKNELHKISGLSRATINKHLTDMINAKKVKQIGKSHYCWADVYRILVKGLKADVNLIENLETASQSFKFIIGQMSLPVNVWRLRQEGNLALSDETFEKGYVTGEELKTLLDHKQKVFGGLRRSFFELAKLLMKVDAAIIHAEEDLSNVEIRFIDGEPVWTVLPEALMRANKNYKIS